MNNTAIEAKGLQKKYGNLLAVRGLDLHVERGEIFGLVGADGAGKTTTIQMLTTLSQPTAGEASILGMDTIRQARDIKEKIGYMSERFTLYPTLTVEENLDFFARLRNLPRSVSEPRKKELLSFCRLEPFRQRHAEFLSGGMQKKLALACSLIHEPEVIFLDEPTTGVDPVSRRDFWRIITGFLSRGITVLVTTPYLDEAERFNRVAFMYQGKIIARDTPGNLKKEMPGEILEIRARPTRRAVTVLGQAGIAASPQLFGETIHLVVEKAGESKANISQFLQQNNIAVDEIKQVPASLEDAFVHLLTGLEDKPSKQAGPGYLTAAQVEPSGNLNPVEVSELTRKFGNFTAVDTVSFDVKPGEIFGLLGPNGSGKTTTIRMITGLLAPTSGSVRVLGNDMALEPRPALSRMGYMSQKFSLFNDLTVNENISFYAGLYGLNDAQLADGKNWVLDMAGLRGKEDSMPRELSGGWKQRLALGCTIIHNPAVIFLDEPTAGVDPLSRRSFWELIEELASRGATIFVTTHYMDEAEHCHRLGMMYQGQLIALGSPQQLKTTRVKGELAEVVISDFATAFSLLSADTRFNQVSLFGSSIHVKTESVEGEAPAIRALLENGGVSVLDINRIPFAMEDVFLALVEEHTNH